MATKPKILFVEDDALIARIYRPKLEQAGFDVTAAEDGLVAMKKLVEFKPDLVVLDLMMPKFTGQDVLKYMRSQAGLKDTSVIIFSNGFLQKIWDETAALGVQEMLLKSAATPQQLIETIHRLLKLSAAAAPEKGSIPATGVKETSSKESAIGFRERIRRDFVQQIPRISRGLKRACLEFLEMGPGSGLVLRLEDLRRKVGFLTHMSGMAGSYRIAQLCSAFEALLFEIQFTPSGVNDSNRHTINSTVELLQLALTHADEPDEQCFVPASILLVDDDLVSSRALMLTLNKANLKSEHLGDAIIALERLRQAEMDLVILDINLPGMTGIELCKRMREMPQHARTPVIFITSYMEFEPLARSVLKCGDDLIGKPIMPVELTVKVIAQLLRRRMKSSTAPAAQA
jgi:DNA-binding response OmpR family regulator